MLCLNMIVKNESARILRALEAAKPHISTFVILDTGSTDDTVAMIREWARDNNINGIVSHGAFVDFSQARNAALRLARSWRISNEFKYLLLQDADMELVVDENASPFFAMEQWQGECYEMNQTGGTVTYTNARLLAAWSSAGYVGRTHEFLACATTGLIEGAHFVDHADGANRENKYERDVDLLKRDIEKNPDDPRAYFYLGNTYRELGQWKEAEEAYRKREAIGGWDEETYVTICNIACCRLGQSDSAGFIAEMLRAHEFRPSRAEPLFDLAKHFREKGNNNTALIFAEKGLSIPRPDDRLFVNDFVYSHGLREEFSIAGYYTSQRERAMKITNGLALDKGNDWSRNLARSNMVHYLQTLDKLAPSIKHSRINIEQRVQNGYVAMNPSVCATPSGALECIVRTVNYRINEHGQYMIGEKGCQDAPIITQNLLITLSDKLDIVEAMPISWTRPEPKFPLVIGLEDMRLFWHKGDRRFIACVREQSERGVPEQWGGILSRRFGSPDIVIAQDAVCLSPDAECEKNWAPIRIGPDLRYVYRLDVMRMINGSLEKTERPFACDNISGSSQWIVFMGGYVAVVHEAAIHPSTGKRVYQHRFAWTNATFSEVKLSLPFTLQGTQIEFCAGLAVHPNGEKFVMSYGLRDEQAWLATISTSDVAALLRLQ